jgi:RND family efflux transporter MFP subunit
MRTSGMSILAGSFTGNLALRGIAAMVSAVLPLTTSCSVGANGPAAAPLTVQVIAAKQKDVPIYKEWIGTLDGLVNADIKAEVSGYLLQQAYTEGSFVQKGQLLFQIDPRPFEAALEQAQGQLAQAQGLLAQAQAQLAQSNAQVSVSEANQRRTQLDVDRYIPLMQQQAITQQDLDNATQNNQAAVAQVQAAKAQVETSRAQILAAEASIRSAKAAVQTAQINLGFTRLTAPIDGIVGIAQQQVGALVSSASGPITTVSTVDPIKAYFVASEQEYIDFARRFPTSAGREENMSTRQLELILADGSVYPRAGKFYFADRQVDVKTGAIRLAGLFPNPENTLRPGQYGRVRSISRTLSGAILVPQRAVTELQGSYQIAVVDGEGKVNIRPVKVGDRTGTDWIINEGVKPGEQVVAEGVQKVRQGMQVNAKPFAGTN